jgi:hypothetical protein
MWIDYPLHTSTVLVADETVRKSISNEESSLARFVKILQRKGLKPIWPSRGSGIKIFFFSSSLQCDTEFTSSNSRY